MSTETIYLIELTASTGTVYRYCTGIGYTSLPTDTPPNAYYEPRVEQPGLFRQNMYSVGTTSGASSGGYGAITLLNTDGGLDTFVDLGFDGQLCVVKEGLPGAALSTFATVITGTVSQCEVSWGLVTLNLKDKTALLDTPVQTVLYAGDNVLPDGREGGTELKDKPKPRLLGNCNNITPVCVNTSKLIYQVNSGPVYDIVAVHDGGNVDQIVKGADYATGALLEAATQPDPTDPATPPSQYLTCLAEGLFRLDCAPFMQLTCDVIEGTTLVSEAQNRTPAKIIGILATEKLGAAGVVQQSIIALDEAAPYIVGYYTGTNVVNTRAVMDALCPSAGAWWGFDNLGQFWVSQLSEPLASQAVMTLTQDEIISIERSATADGDKGIPVYRVNVDFSKNWTVQTSGLAGSVAGNQLNFEPDNTAQLTTDRKNLLSMEYLRTKKEDLAVQATHLLAPEITIKTTLDSPAAANTEAQRVLDMRKVRRDRLKVKVPKQATQYPDGGYWDDQAIAEMPFARTNHSAAVYGNWLYILGGTTGNGAAHTASVIRLDLSNPTGAWDDAGVTDLPAKRFNFSTAVYGNWLYVIGGYDETPTRLASVVRLDLSNPTGAWDDAGVTDLPVARNSQRSEVYGTFLYVIGGYQVSAHTASVIRLDLSNPTGAWDDAGVTDLPAVRRFFSTSLSGSYLYVIGGINTLGEKMTSIVRLDLSTPTGTWDDAGVTDLPVARSSHTSVVVDGWLYVMGGWQNVIVPRLNLSTPTGSWINMSSLPAYREDPVACGYMGQIYMAGGYTLTEQANTWRLRQNSIPEDAAHRTSLGRTVLIEYPRYGYDSGRPMKIIGTESDLKSRVITLELWG